MKPLRPIHSDDDHKDALTELRALWDAQPGTPQGDRFESLSILVDEYERRTIPIAPPDPITAILFRLDQLGVSGLF